MTAPVDAADVDIADILDFFDIGLEVGDLEGRRISTHTLADFYEKVKQKNS